MRILVVDDDDMIRQLLEIGLQLGGHSVESADSGQQALIEIEASAKPFDCFLVDIQMPKMTGIELCAHIRTRQLYFETPIVMLTAMSEKRYIDAAFASGATDYINKPFEIEDLKTRILLAEKQITKSRELPAASQSLNLLSEQMTEDSPYQIEDAIPIVDVDYTMSPQTLVNYLRQLGRWNQAHSRIFAIKVVNVSAIFSNSSGLEFGDVIADVAEVIANCLCEISGLLCYLGNGIYCCVIDSKHKEALCDLNCKLENEVYTMGLIYRNGRPVDLEFRVGESVTPNPFSKADSIEVVQEAIHKLIANDQRESIKRLALGKTA